MTDIVFWLAVACFFLAALSADRLFGLLLTAGIAVLSVFVLAGIGVAHVYGAVARKAR